MDRNREERNLGQELDASYYLVIPYAVLKDQRLSDAEKLLYGQITALTKSKGYCYASNDYLASMVDKAADTVSRQVNHLKTLEYVRVEIIRDPENNAVLERRIYPIMSVLHIDRKNIREGIGKKSDTPPGEKAEENNIALIKEVENPPKAPRGAGRKGPKKQPDHKPERFDRFWKFYPRRENKQAAIRAWDRLSPPDELIDTMAKALKCQMQSDDWKRGIGIPYASTWLNNARWEDEVKDVAPVPEMDTRGGLPVW